MVFKKPVIKRVNVRNRMSNASTEDLSTLKIMLLKFEKKKKPNPSPPSNVIVR